MKKRDLNTIVKMIEKGKISIKEHKKMNKIVKKYIIPRA